MKKNDINQEQRFKFIDFWAKYVRTHDDNDWSRQQNIVINQIPNMTKEQFLEMKKEGKYKQRNLH